MPIVGASPRSDDGKPSVPAWTEDGKEGTVPIPEVKTGGRYIYYRLYTKDGPLESNCPIYSNDRFISRILSTFVRPPHTAALLKKYLCKVEGLKQPEKCTLYQSLTEQTALENSTRLSFRGTPGPGLCESNPMVLVAGERTAENRSQPASTVDPSNLLEREYGQCYVYYRLYDEDGGAVSKTSFDENNAILGRVSVLSIPPPHTVASLKNHLMSSEEILGHNIQLFEDDDSEFPMEDGEAIALLADTFPGFADDRPVAIAYESGRNTGPVGNEDPNEKQARELREARSALEESKKTHARELAQVRQELEQTTQELREARSALERVKELGVEQTLIQALLEMPSFTKKLKATDTWHLGDPKWHSLHPGDIFYTDGISRQERYGNSSCDFDCYRAINSSGKLACGYCLSYTSM